MLATHLRIVALCRFYKTEDTVGVVEEKESSDDEHVLGMYVAPIASTTAASTNSVRFDSSLKHQPREQFMFPNAKLTR